MAKDAHSAIRATESGGKTRQQASALLPGALAIPFKAALEVRSTNEQPSTRVENPKIFATSFSKTDREPGQARSPREQSPEDEQALIAELPAQGDAGRDQPRTIEPLTSWPVAREQAAPQSSLGLHESDHGD
jgi:hypothetical protein